MIRPLMVGLKKNEVLSQGEGRECARAKSASSPIAFKFPDVLGGPP